MCPMKRKYTFIAILASAALTSVFGGPVAIESKESKAVVPMVQKECTWTGIYFGAHGGYSFGDNLNLQEIEKESGEANDPPFDLDQDGAIYGGQIGVNWQIGHWFVIGAEVAFSGTDISDTETKSTGSTANEDLEVNRAHFSSDWLVDVKLRGGISFWQNRLLAYATGGPSFTRFHYDNHQVETGPERFHAEEGRIGGVVGCGLEYALTCHWSIRLEYNHYIFDSEKILGQETDSSNQGVKKEWISDVGDRNAVVAGINYKF
jgi:outer membrane immunogenic protein